MDGFANLHPARHQPYAPVINLGFQRDGLMIEWGLKTEEPQQHSSAPPSSLLVPWN